jgi:hypothetical protein
VTSNWPDMSRTGFADELRVAFDAWGAAGRPTNAPFGMPQYLPPGTTEGQAAEQRADQLFSRGLITRRGDNYSMLAVLAALVLFYGALSGRLPRPPLQWAALIFAGVLFLFGAVVAATFPVIICYGACCVDGCAKRHFARSDAGLAPNQVRARPGQHALFGIPQLPSEMGQGHVGVAQIALGQLAVDVVDDGVVNDLEKRSTPGNAGSWAADGVVRRRRNAWPSAVDGKISGLGVVDGSVRI